MHILILVVRGSAEIIYAELTNILVQQRGDKRENTERHYIADGRGQRRGHVVGIHLELVRRQYHSHEHKICSQTMRDYFCILGL